MILFVETLKKLAEPLHYGVLFHFFLAQYVLFWAAVCLQSPPMKLTLFGTLAHVYIEWTLKGLPEWLCFIDVSVEESESDYVFEHINVKFGSASSWIDNKNNIESRPRQNVVFTKRVLLMLTVGSQQWLLSNYNCLRAMFPTQIFFFTIIYSIFFGMEINF